MVQKQVLILLGPTSSGKSTLAVRIAKRFNGEIISADSRQVYRGLDIGTGKISKKEMRGIPHYLLDVASAKRTFTAHEYGTRARAVIADITFRNKLPIVTGGTGFYIDVLTGHVQLSEVPANRTFRRTHDTLPITDLFRMLQKRDPRRARTIDPHNKQRIIRALEIAYTLGSVPKKGPKKLYDVLWIGLEVPKRELEKKIHTRLIARLKTGMVAEARRLHREGLSYRRMEALGLEYRALARYLQKKTSWKEMMQEMERDIRAYAKRQQTYWRRNNAIEWFAPNEEAQINKKIRSWKTS